MHPFFSSAFALNFQHDFLTINLLMPTLFIYGTLLFPELLQALLERIPERQPAVLPGYQRYRIYDGSRPRPYPAIYPNAEGEVKGALLYGLQPAELALLDEYEEEDYLKQPCQAWVADQLVDAQVYVWRSEQRSKLRGEWEPEWFRAHHLGRYIREIYSNF